MELLDTEDGMYELRRPNRRRARAPKRTQVWCFACDGALVSPDEKCPHCGARERTRKRRFKTVHVSERRNADKRLVLLR